uniref:Uncharacterized protein n=1 Tax=Engystomops pustulosus TaxID=76066 RepID=A0AAV6YXQ2_ENGPU|nr:hypothetical protein GDO81_020008 [Engystomops pustulosus]
MIALTACHSNHSKPKSFSKLYKSNSTISLLLWDRDFTVSLLLYLSLGILPLFLLPIPDPSECIRTFVHMSHSVCIARRSAAWIFHDKSAS